jgi:GH24 family phage-related lysozyme (muramidase)
MPPTPEQLLIEQSNQIVQAPQVQETIVKPTVVEEAQVSMPAPNNWIGQIDYGMDWYGVGAKAFNVAQSVYTNVLDYNVRKTVGQISDLQYDLRTKMRNTYAESFNVPKNMVERPEAIDYNSAFTKAKPFEQEYKDKTNEFIGIKDSDGNLTDVFAEDYDLSGLGTKYMEVVDIARKGLYDISADSERVQKDLLETTKKQFELNRSYSTWMEGNYITKEAARNLPLYQFSTGNSPLNAVLPAEQIIQADKNNVVTANGQPVIRKDENNNYFINPNASETDKINALGENGYKTLIEADAREAMGARGVNLPADFKDKTVTILRSNNVSIQQAAWLQAHLKYASPEKLEQLLKNEGQDLSALEKSKLYVAWARSGANIPMQEELTPQSYATMITGVTNPASLRTEAILKRVTGLTPTNEDTALFGPKNTLVSYYEASKQIFKNMYKDSLNEEELNAITANDASFTNYLNQNPNIIPYLGNALIMYDTALTQGLSNEQAQNGINISFSGMAIKDDAGRLFIPRNQNYVQLDGYKTKTNTFIKNRRVEALNNPSVFVDEKTTAALETKSPQQLAFTVGYLNTSTDETQIAPILNAIDSSFIPTDSLLTPEDRVSLITSAKARTEFSGDSNSKTGVVRGQSISEGPTLTETLRVGVATQPSVLKFFNNGRMPATKEEAIRVASVAYQALGPTETWGWSHKQRTEDDQLTNSQNGGLVFGLTSLPVVVNGEEKDLLKERAIVSPSNASYVTFQDPTRGYVTMLPSSFISDPRFEEHYAKALGKLVSGQRPTPIEIDDGTTPTTNKEISGFAAAAYYLAQTKEQGSGFAINEMAQALTATEIKTLSEEITLEEANTALRDPRIINRVAAILKSNFNTDENTSKEILHNILTNDDLSSFIQEYDINQDGKMQKIDLMASLYVAALGYKNNKTYREGTQDVYPNPLVSSFWGMSLQNEQPMNQTSRFSYTAGYEKPVDMTSLEYTKSLSPSVDFVLSGQEKQLKNNTAPGAVNDKQGDIWWQILGDKEGAGEGLKLQAYQDQGGIWTVGYGTTRYSDGTPVKQGDTVTEEEAVDMANYKIYNDIIPTLEKRIPTWNDMNENQQAAIVSFAYNYGEYFYGKPNFETITKALSDKENFVDVPTALKLYNKGLNKKTGKKEVQGGLVKRREKEGQLWIQGTKLSEKFDEQNLKYLKNEYQSFDLEVGQIPKDELDIMYKAIVSRVKERVLSEKYQTELEQKLGRRLDGSDDKLYMQLNEDHPDLAKAKEDARKTKKELMRTKFFTNTREKPERNSKGNWNYNNALIFYEQRVNELMSNINRIHNPNKV